MIYLIGIKRLFMRFVQDLALPGMPMAVVPITSTIRSSKNNCLSS